MKEYLVEALSEHESRLSAHIDTAATVTEGKRFIDMAFVEGEAYDVIILDLMLPKETGFFPEIDDSLCLAVRKVTPDTLIVHLSAYIHDDAIENHVRTHHIESIDRSFTLSKLNVDYPTQLANRLKIFLYGNQIEGQIVEVFGATGHSNFGGRSSISRRPRSTVSTHDLASLCRNIVQYWNYLDEPLKQRIQQLFYVDGDSDPIRISLM
jgi:CheY-like chemotaxis protein